MKIMDHVFTSDRILEVLKSSRLFSQFTDDQLIHLISLCHVEQYRKDDVILREQEPNQKLFILLKGCVAVFTGDELIQKLWCKGDIIGEMSVITRSLTTASVIAETHTFLFTIPSEKVYSTGHDGIQSIWFKIFSDILAQRLARTTQKVIGFQETTAQLQIKKKELTQKTVVLQSILGSMSDGVVVTDQTGKLLHVNKAFTDLVGLKEIPENFDDWPEKLGMYRSDGKTMYTRAELPMEKAAKGITIDAEEIYIANPYLKEGIWLQAGSSPLRNEDGSRPDGSVVVFRNYTRTKQAELTLIAAKENAEAAAKAKSNFLSVMSHELRTPLNGILGMSALLKITRLTREQKDCVRSIQKSGQLLLDKIQNILYFNLFESGEIQLKSVIYHPDRIVEDIINRFEAPAAQKQITITTDICKTASQPVTGDPEKITRILDLLMENAIKFTPKGSIGIQMAVRPKDNRIIEFSYSIRDTGIGMTQPDITKLFHPFAQADVTLGRRFEGTGLGLAICKNLIEMMGGHIHVESTPEKGSCFTFTILQEKAVSEETDSKNKPSTQEKIVIDKRFSEKHPLRILVAEDNKVNRLLIKKVLSKLGYTPDIAENGLEAVQACLKKQYDVILMDIQMPEMDGLEASTIILETARQSKKPAIIALTANTTDEIREQCVSTGMTGFMTKPLDIHLLMQVLETIRDDSD